MKIITKCVIDMMTGETLEEQSYDYEGPVALCGGGSGGGTVDKEYNARIASIMESQQGQAEGLYNFYRYGTFDAPGSTAPSGGGQGSGAGAAVPASSLHWAWNGGDASTGFYNGYDENGNVVATSPTVPKKDATVQVSSGTAGGGGSQTSTAPAPAIVGTGANGQVTLDDILKQNPSYANMELAQVAANMGLIGGQTALAGEQIESQRTLLPGQTKLLQEQTASQRTLLPGQTKLLQEQTASQRGILPSQTAATIASNRYTANTQPMKQQAVTDALALAGRNTESEAARMAGAEVAQAFNTKQQTLGESIRRTGAVAGSGRMAGLQEDLDLNRVKATAGARTAARQNARTTQYDQLAKAIQII